MVAVAAVAVLVVVSVGLLAGAATARARAGAAADAAALAAASVAQLGGDGCTAALRLATAHGAQLSGCMIGAHGADITVTLPLRWGIGRLAHAWTVTGRARAGPEPSHSGDP